MGEDQEDGCPSQGPNTGGEAGEEEGGVRGEDAEPYRDDPQGGAEGQRAAVEARRQEEMIKYQEMATALIRMWSILTPTEAREHLVTGSIRWETVARDLFNRFE